MYKSVMDIPDSLVISRCLSSLKGYILPRNLTDGERKIEVALCRLKLADYNLNTLKELINKGKSVKEDDLKQAIEDVRRSQLALYDIGR